MWRIYYFTNISNWNISVLWILQVHFYLMLTLVTFKKKSFSFDDPPTHNWSLSARQHIFNRSLFIYYLLCLTSILLDLDQIISKTLQSFGRENPNYIGLSLKCWFVYIDVSDDSNSFQFREKEELKDFQIYEKGLECIGKW